MIENTEHREGTNQTDIERIVMRRVRLIRLLALVISTATLAVLTFVAALWGIGKEIWVAQVFQNAPANIVDLPRFYLDAFMHARLIVQALSVLTLISLFFLAREMVRFISSSSVRA